MDGRRVAARVALEHKFLMADAKPTLDAQLQHAQPWAELLEEQIKEERIKTAALMDALRGGR